MIQYSARAYGQNPQILSAPQYQNRPQIGVP